MQILDVKAEPGGAPEAAGGLNRAQIGPLLAELVRRRPNGRGALYAFAGTQHGDGTTFVTRLVARELARKHRVECLVITLDQVGALPEYPGEADGDSFYEAIPGVWTPLGPERTGRAVTPDVLMRRLSRLKQWPGGMVLIDCPPPDVANCAAPSVFGRVDGTVVVVAAGSTTRQEIDRAGRLLKRGEAKVLGMVLNRRKYAIPRPFRRYL